ncbi:hypothetical protein MUG94_15000 [Arthrobacter gengyunqii]|uniref:Uncharacterized protein n=1 Tax=Arthrobacter gengyunqii TaxID=2886940 RepID=A0A9X1LZU3_9MICC|nr:hypothetical protein [Arthrobacter gengyunqii]MCC3268426.1 hypothetical protein [Arthrobacter gengyunqii]UOY95819.1 hypothetical protein MUG94_15000 [Arthrobacter gengyunqii]
MNQPPVENDARTATETPAPSESHSAGKDNVRTAVLGPFGLRDTVVGGSVLLMLIGSLLPWSLVFGLEANLWSPVTPLFFLGIGIILPLLVAGLFAARRMAPELKYRVGSLSVDQFGSVVAVLAVAFFFLQLVNVFTIGTMLTFIGALGLVAATTLAPHIPPFSREFSERPAEPAHVMARDAVRLRRRPARPAPADSSAPGASHDAKPAESRLSGMGKGMGKLAPTGLFGRKTDDGVPADADAPAVNGIPADAATGATAAAPAAPAGQAVRSEPAATEGARVQGAGSESVREQSGADKVPSPAPSPSPAPAAAAAPAPARSNEDDLAATTVNPVVSAKQSEAEPATQAAPKVPASSGSDSISATRDESENVVEAFWFAVGTPRQIVDERTGLPLFMFHPGDWELGLEDRGTEFLVQDKRTGRIGVLRDLSNIERVGEDSGE